MLYILKIQNLLSTKKPKYRLQKPNYQNTARIRNTMQESQSDNWPYSPPSNFYPIKLHQLWQIKKT